MATSNNPQMLTLEAGGDLSTHQFKLVKQHTTANQVVLCGDGENAIGVLYEPSAAAGRAVAVANGGVVRGYAGATIAIGAKVSSDANGLFTTAVATDHVLGTAKTAGANGVMMEVFWDKQGILAA